MKKKIIACLMMAGVLFVTPISSVAAAEMTAPIMTREELDSATPADEMTDNAVGMMPRSADSKSYTIPGDQGTITSNAWRSTSPDKSGNTYQWDYQVSAVYTGSKAVSSIRTTWKGSASLRYSASISLGISDSSVNAGGSSAWQNVSTVAKYWENSNGATESSYRSNMVVTPAVDYRSNTISITNTARVVIKGDAKPYEITASC